MKGRFILSFVFLSFIQLGVAQDNVDPKIEASDPMAVQLLDKISKKLNSSKNYSAVFNFTIAHPEEEAITKKGSLIQEGNKYFVDLEDQTFTCDGNSVWVHMVPQKEVQINDVEESDEGLNNPSDFLSIYEKESFIFGILTTYTQGKNNIKEVEFKPTDRGSEYSKVRIIINETSKEIKEVITFFKNGSQYTLSVDNWKLNIATTENQFTFDATKFPGVYVEDLRF